MTESITALLDAWREGKPGAENALVNEVYPILRNLARAQVRRNGEALTLGATELVHEAYERLNKQQSVDWKNRQHFYAIAATVMRRVAIDYLRERAAEKRGGDVMFIDLDAVTDGSLAEPGKAVDWIALDQALTALEAEDPGLAKVAELRLLSGLEMEAIAEVTGVSIATVGRQWRFARVWLSEQLDPASQRG